MLLNALSFAHLLINEALMPGGTAVDATAGKGKDTLLLSKAVGDHGKVIALDIQEEAIIATRQLLLREKCTNVKLYQSNHSSIGEILETEHISQLDGAIFNLGYLPGASKKLITRPETTMKALASILYRLKPGGLVVMVVYHGHSGGQSEKSALAQYSEKLDQQVFHVLKYEFINQKNNPPLLFAIERREGSLPK